MKKFRMEYARYKHSHDATYIKLSKYEQGVSVDQILYRSMIDILLYITSTRPNVTYSIGVYTCYQANLKTSHLT